MSCGQGSPGSEPGQRAHRPCSPASVRTGPAGIPVRGCVDVRAHTREAREPRAYRSCTPLPHALPSSSSSLSPVSDSLQKNSPNCPTYPSINNKTPVRDGQTHPHRPRLVVSHSTCPPLSSSPHAHSFVTGPAVIKHTHPTNLFSSPHRLSGSMELMSNISATRGHPGMRICVCGSPRGNLSHIASLTLGCSRSDFSGANRRAQDHTCGG
jgi:hypothetical protein